MAFPITPRWSRACSSLLAGVVERIAGDVSGELAAARVFQALLGGESGESSDALCDGLPSGSVLYRFEALDASCPVASLPTMKSRLVSREHVQSLLVAQSRMLSADVKSRKLSTDVKSRKLSADAGESSKSLGIGSRSAARFAAITSALGATALETKEASPAVRSSSDEQQFRAFIVPTSGAYSNAHLTFAEGIRGAQPAGLDQVRRIFVLASVWDCYIDGCGLPERRCAWYGDMPLDLVVLERLRSSRAFTELTVEQDMRERAVEVLLPLIDTCFAKRQDFTLVPVLVGGVMPKQAEHYSKLLAPYLADPANLFVVAGDVDELGDSLQSLRNTAAKADNVTDAAAQDDSSSDGPSNTSCRWLREVPVLLNQRDRFAPVHDALELFLAALVQAPQHQQLSLSRFW